MRPGSRSKLAAEVATASEIFENEVGAFDGVYTVVSAVQAGPDNLYAWLPLMYWRGMLNGKGRLGPLLNAQYPAIHPTGVREYVKRMVAGKESFD